MESSFAVRQVVVPYSHEDVVEPELANERLVQISASEILESRITLRGRNVAHGSTKLTTHGVAWAEGETASLALLKAIT